MLALGISALSATGLQTLGTIVASAAWVAGSIIIPGNVILIPDANTTTTPSIYVGTKQTYIPRAGGLDFITNGTQSGVVLKTGNVTAYQTFPVACTSTGGLTKYPTCIASSPFSTSGALIDVAVDCGLTNVNMLMSGSFVKSNSATSFGAAVLKNVTVGSGSLKNRMSQSGAQLIWNPADKIRITTTTASPNTAANCTMWVTARDKSGT